MLSRANLELATLATSDKSRFTLNAILVRPDMTIETDGHQMVLVQTPLGAGTFTNPQLEICGKQALTTWKPFLLSVSDALRIAKAIPKSKTLPILNHAFILEVREPAEPANEKETKGPRIVVLGVTDLESPQLFECRVPAGNFPDHERVIPKWVKPFTIGISSELNQKVNTFISKRQSGIKSTEVSFQDAHCAQRIVARLEDGCEVKALIMPLRLDNSGKDTAPEMEPLDNGRRAQHIAAATVNYMSTQAFNATKVGLTKVIEAAMIDTIPPHPADTTAQVAAATISTSVQ